MNNDINDNGLDERLSSNAGGDSMPQEISKLAAKTTQALEPLREEFRANGRTSSTWQKIVHAVKPFAVAIAAVGVIGTISLSPDIAEAKAKASATLQVEIGPVKVGIKLGDKDRGRGHDRDRRDNHGYDNDRHCDTTVVYQRGKQTTITECHERPQTVIVSVPNRPDHGRGGRGR